MPEFHREVFGQYTITFQDMKNIYATWDQGGTWQYFHLCQGSWSRPVPKDLDMRVAQLMAERYLATAC